MNRNHFVQILMFLAVFVLIPVKNSDASWSDWLEKGQTVLNQAVEKAQELGGQASKGASQLVSWGKARYNQATAPDIELISCMASEKKGWLDAINPAFSAANPKIKVKTEIAGSGTLVADVNSGNKLGCDILSTASSISTVLLEGGHRAVSYLVFSPTVVIADQERAAVMRTYFQETYKSDAITLVRLAKVAGNNWETVGGQKSWGIIKVATTIPSLSNSGLTAIISIGNEAADTYAGLSEGNMAAALEAVTKAGQVFTHNEKSTGRLTSDVEKKGNYSANFVVTYENLAINVVTSNKRKDWEIIYPTYGVMNDHPIIVLTTDPDKQAAAKHYVEYLTGKSAQLIAVKQFGFRPAHKDVDMFVEGSPFANKVLEGKLNLEPPAVEPPADSGALYSLIEAYEGGK